MLQLLLLTTALAHFTAVSGPPADCPRMVAGKDIQISISSHKTACVSVVLNDGEAAQFLAENEADLALNLHGGDREILVNEFQFGRETLTITTPGTYRIEIRAIQTLLDIPPSPITMSLRSLPLQVASQWKAAEAMATKSKQSRALADVQASLELWRIVDDLNSIGRTRLRLGDVLIRSDPSAAQAAYEQALKDCLSVGEIRCAAEAANNVGLTSRQLGDFDLSHKRLMEAIEYWHRLQSLVNEGKTLSNLGVLYTRVGDFQLALSTFRRARSVLLHLDPLAYPRVLNNLGLCYLSLAEYAKAQIYFERAIRAESKLKGALPDEIRARINLGRAQILTGQLAQAKTAIERALAQELSLARGSQGQSDRAARAFALNNLGQIDWMQGRLNDARTHLQDALEIHRAIGDRRGEAIALHHLGLVAETAGQLPLARQQLTEATRIRRECGMRDEASESLGDLAQLEFAIGNNLQAAKLAEEAMALLESVRSRVPGAALRASFYARRRKLLELTVAIAMKSGGVGAAERSLLAADRGRSRALLDLLAEQHFTSSEPSDLHEQRAGIRRAIALASYRASTESKERENNIRMVERLVAEDEELYASLRESTATQEPVAQPLISLSELHDFLQPDIAILEYQLGEKCSYLWLVRREGVNLFELPSRKAIESNISLAAGLFGKLNDRRSDPKKQAVFEVAMHRLARTLLGPIRESDLPLRLFLALDGDLHRLPFEALHFPGSRPLGLDHDLVRIPSAAYLIHGAKVPALAGFPKSILTFCDPVFSAEDSRITAHHISGPTADPTNLSRIVFNDELKILTSLVPSPRRRILCSFNANVEAVRTLSLADYAILYFSTHAIVDDQVPEISRIVLSRFDRHGHPLDGSLFSSQLADLHLAGSVVVLSACDTALGKPVVGEGLLGFATSLFSAGASQLVVTLTEVDGKGSSVFMSEVYRHVFGRKHTNIEHALTLARRTLANSQRWSDPYYWASFVLIGMPNGTDALTTAGR